MPHLKSLKESIRRRRAKKEGFISEACEDIPEILKKDFQGNIFSRFDSGINDINRFVLFYSEYNGKFIGKCEQLLIEGTSRSAPQGFKQILSINGKICVNSTRFFISF